MATTEPDGIWSPDETNNFDWVAHFARMADSVQVALSNLRSELKVKDTGWTTEGLTIGSGFNHSGIAYRVRGGDVMWRGQIYGGTAPTKNHVIATFPAEFAPPDRMFVHLWQDENRHLALKIGNFEGENVPGSMNMLRFQGFATGSQWVANSPGYQLNDIRWSV